MEALLADTSLQNAGLDIAKLSEFLIPGPDDPRKAFDALSAATTSLKNYQAELEREMSVLYRQKRRPELPPVSEHSRFKHRVLHVLADTLVETWDGYRQIRQLEVQEKHPIIIQMLTLLDYISQKKLKLLPNMDVLKDPKGGHSQERKKYAAVKTALKKKIEEYVANVDEFADDSHSLNAVKAYIDQALEKREPGEAYFEGIDNEERVMMFLESANSPLAKAHLLPIAIEHTFEQVIAWIESAVTALAKWEGTGKYERRSVMYVMLTRLLFDKMHAQLACTQNLSTSTEELATDEDVMGWLDRAQFAVCPIDAAYAVYMAHKVMGDRAVNSVNPFESEGDTSLEQMAEVVRKSDLVDAPAFAKWLREWSRLSGFSAKSVAAIGFLERQKAA